ncbi:hypothetical protein Tco_1445825, partial [Tanacetum coccineum]
VIYNAIEIIERVGPVAYRLKLPHELSCVHDTFHVLNLKKCLAEPDVQVPLDEIERVGPVAYRLKLPQELSCVHDTFHVLNLKKCLAEPDVQVPLDEIEVDENLRFVEVRWNSRQGAEYTWEREDQFRIKYPHLFSEPVPSSNVAT